MYGAVPDTEEVEENEHTKYISINPGNGEDDGFNAYNTVGSITNFQSFQPEPRIIKKAGMCKAFIVYLGVSVGSLCALAVGLVGLQMVSAMTNVYDYIIIGGGPAGSVIARKLSEDPKKKVLLLEAGMPSQFELGGKDYFSAPFTVFDIPLMWSSVSHVKEYHWEIHDRTQKNWPNVLIAKALGGCGVHNAMLYVRAIKEDFEAWQVEGWDWDMALPHYMAMERYDPTAGGLYTFENGTQASHVPEWHGTDGPIVTSPPLWIDEVASYFLESCAAAGVPLVDDFNKPGGREGAGMYTFSINNGIRDSAARAVLGPIIMGKVKRPNLTIMTSAEVRRILLQPRDPENARVTLGSEEQHLDAVGIEYVQNGVSHTARLFPPGASIPTGDKGLKLGKSIVVTAGALLTPKILMASGIGDKKILEKKGLPALLQSPGVGQNLQDHPGVGLFFKSGPALLDVAPSGYRVAQDLQTYTVNVMRTIEADSSHVTQVASIGSSSPAWSSKFGIFASTGLTAGAFLRSGLSEGTAPDIQLTLFPQVTEPHILVLNHSRPADMAMPSILITIALLSPEGRKSVVLHADDPVDGDPHLEEGRDMPSLTDFDVERMVWAVKKVQELHRLPPLSAVTEQSLTPDLDENMTHEELMKWVKEHVYGNSHWSGTARMGDRSDPNNVVDHRLRVHGASFLRVADASVIPHIPNGNVHSTVLLISSRAAEMMKQDASGSYVDNYADITYEHGAAVSSSNSKLEEKDDLAETISPTISPGG